MFHSTLLTSFFNCYHNLTHKRSQLITISINHLILQKVMLLQTDHFSTSMNGKHNISFLFCINISNSSSKHTINTHQSKRVRDSV